MISMNSVSGLLMYFCSLFLMSALVSSTATMSDINFASFESSVNMPYAMSDMVATTFPEDYFDDGKGPRIYLTGGCVSDQSCPDATDSTQGTCFCTQITSSVIYFAPQTKEFHSVASMPQKRYRHLAARVGRYLFVAGGRNLSDVILPEIDRYDVVTNVWETVAQWPNATSDGVAFADQTDDNTDLLYLTGGYEQDYTISGALSALNTTSFKFDQNYPSMTVPRGDVQVAMLGDNFYVIGGWSDSQFCTPSKVVEYFSVSSHAWFTAQSMHEGRGDLVCGVLDSNMLFAVAGETKSASDSTCSSSVPVPDVERYLGPVNDTWKFEEDIPLGLFRFSGASYNTSSSLYSSAIYLFGGQSTFNQSTKSFAVRNSTLVYYPEAIYGSRRNKTPLDAGGIAGIVVAGIVVLGCVLTALVAFFGYRYSRYRYQMLQEEQQQVKPVGGDGPKSVITGNRDQQLEMQAMQDSFPSFNRV